MMLLIVPLTQDPSSHLPVHDLPHVGLDVCVVFVTSAPHKSDVRVAVQSPAPTVNSHPQADDTSLAPHMALL